jgi:hypothetical protein
VTVELMGTRLAETVAAVAGAGTIALTEWALLAVAVIAVLGRLARGRAAASGDTDAGPAH